MDKPKEKKKEPYRIDDVVKILLEFKAKYGNIPVYSFKDDAAYMNGCYVSRPKIFFSDSLHQSWGEDWWDKHINIK